MPHDVLGELASWAQELLESARVAHLGVIDDTGAPRVLPVTFAVAGGGVWSAVDDKPKRSRSGLARLRWLEARPGSSLTVDRYDDDWARLAWVQLVGRTDVVALDGFGWVVDALAERYAPYRVSRPPGPLLRFTPVRAVCWRASG
jgi:PPOX class probable F420-dependent enzyme